jgi:peptidoglycan/xylan/chitin deacetylase (PgdA/CDA1 family)
MKYLITLLLFISLTSHGQDSCVILLYHHFSDKTPKSTSISPKLFEQQLQYLKDNNFNVLPLKTVLQKAKNKTLPKKCVSLTTDDAYISVYHNAFPLLKKYNVPMAVFVATEATDKKYRAMMSWEQMRKIQGKYVQFYNHTKTHAHLIDIPLKQVFVEIKGAQQRLKKELGVTDKIFAYPYGEFDNEVYHLVRDMGYISFGQHSGAMGSYSDFSMLPRFPMAYKFASMKSFKVKVNTFSFPILKQNPINTTIFNQDKSINLTPILTIMFDRKFTKAQQKTFNCFDYKGRIETSWWRDNVIRIRAKNPFSSRRGRYNCTMPSKVQGHYYWLSKQWINPLIAEK